MTCTAAVSARCCWSTWSRWPAAGESAPSSRRRSSENAPMLQVFADAGLRAHRALADGVYEVSFPLPASEGDAGLGTYRDAVAERERSADVASLRHVLTPASVAVIGASRRPGSVGRAILQNIIDGGFRGRGLRGQPGRRPNWTACACVPSAAALPEQVDLAVIAAPTAAVVGIAEDCGRRGVKALVVTTSGLDGAARAELLGICRRHGMRLVGPTCFGVANTAISPGRDVRGPPSRAGNSRPGAAVRRRRHGPARAPVPARHRDLLLRLPRRQGRRVRQRHAAVVEVRCGDEAGRALPGFVREPAQVRPDGPGRRPRHADPDRERGPVRGWAGAWPRCPRRGGHPAAHQAGPVRAGWPDRHRQLSASCSTPRRCWHPSRCPPETGSAWCPTPAAAACSPPTRAATWACRSPACPRTLSGRSSLASCSPPTWLRWPGRSIPRRRWRRACSAGALELVGADPGVDAVLVLTATTATSDLVSEVRAARLPVPDRRRGDGPG